MSRSQHSSHVGVAEARERGFRVLSARAGRPETVLATRRWPALANFACARRI